MRQLAGDDAAKNALFPKFIQLEMRPGKFVERLDQMKSQRDGFDMFQPQRPDGAIQRGYFVPQSVIRRVRHLQEPRRQTRIHFEHLRHRRKGQILIIT